MNNDLRRELRALVDSFADSIAADLERLVERHAVRLVADRLGTTLAIGSSSRSNGARSSASVPRRAKPAPNPAKNGARILAHVRANPGVRSEHVRAALGISKGAWVYALNALIAEKKIARKGEKRASTLHAV